MSSPIVARRSSTFSVLFLVFSFELIAISIARLPNSMAINTFAFCDQGANLTLQYLLSKGLRPAIDFGYAYGLLPVIFGRVWFAIFGATPWAYQLAMEAFAVLSAWALAKILAQLKIGYVGLALTIVIVGYAYQATYTNFAHGIEAVLISHAVAEQASGRRANALLLASLAVFTKPTMGFVYSLLLVVLIVRDLVSRDFSMRRWLMAFAPTMLVFGCLALVLAFIYGGATVIHTVLPLEGAVNYRALNYGITGQGADLWDPKGMPWIFYLVDVSGFLIAGTIFLFSATAYRLGQIFLGNSSLDFRGEILLTCAILFFAFLALFFGSQWSWTYYSYLLVIGCAIAADLGNASRRIGLVLCALALFSWTDVVYWNYRWWRTTEPASSTAGLWASSDERAEWLSVLAKARGHKAVMLDRQGATELLFPGFEDPVSLFLLKGLMTPQEIQRKLAQISGADIVIVPMSIGDRGGDSRGAGVRCGDEELCTDQGEVLRRLPTRRREISLMTSPDSCATSIAIVLSLRALSNDSGSAGPRPREASDLYDRARYRSAANDVVLQLVALFARRTD